MQLHVAHSICSLLCSWYSQVRISASNSINESTFQTAVHALITAKVLPPEAQQLTYKHFIDSKFVNLEVDIRQMKLYNNENTILTSLYNNLRSIGKATGKLSVEELLPFDQNHYNGTAALDIAAQLCHLTPYQSAQSVSTPLTSLLQVGSSVGGPVRYFVNKYRVRALGIELQVGNTISSDSCMSIVISHSIAGMFYCPVFACPA